MIGLSLSVCVQDIVTQKIPLEKVSLIVVNTKGYSEEHWRHIWKEYCTYCWEEYENETWDVLCLLRATGKIFQPRLHANYAPGMIMGGLSYPWIDVDLFWEGKIDQQSIDVEKVLKIDFLCKDKVEYQCNSCQKGWMDQEGKFICKFCGSTDMWYL